MKCFSYPDGTYSEHGREIFDEEVESEAKHDTGRPHAHKVVSHMMISHMIGTREADQSHD